MNQCQWLLSKEIVMKNYGLEGQYISGVYCDQFKFVGQVVESRVEYGGDIQHTVELSDPLTVFGADREEILISQSELEKNGFQVL